MTNTHHNNQPDPLDAKLTALKHLLQQHPRVIIAFSGGVDSTFLLKVALDTLGPENILPCLGLSPTVPQAEAQAAADLAAQLGATPGVASATVAAAMVGIRYRTEPPCRPSKIAPAG